MTKYSYRVAWKREGIRPKYRRFEKKDATLRFVALLGPEPWKAHGRDPDKTDYYGQSVREEYLDRRSSMPPIEWVRIERRPVGQWEEVKEVPDA